MVRNCIQQSRAEADTDAVKCGLESEACEAACARLLTQAVDAAGLDSDTQACLDDAFRTLEELQEKRNDHPQNDAVQGKVRGHPSTPTVLDGSKEELQSRLLQSASIMRKLYTRNTALEGKLALIQTSRATAPCDGNISPSATLEVDPGRNGGGVLSLPANIGLLRPSTCPSKGQSMAQISLLHQKDAVIGQLKEALNSSQRQVHLLRAALERGDGGGSTAARPTSRPSSRNRRLSISQAESSTGFLRSDVSVVSDTKRLKQLQRDYSSMLRINISKLHGRAPAAAQQLLEAAEQRIAAEGAINELEMSACHARLMEFERQQADWYVQKRLMQDENRELQHKKSELQQQLQHLQTQLAAATSESLSGIDLGAD